MICSLAINDDDENEEEVGQRLDARKKEKLRKDVDRLITAMIKHSTFAERGFNQKMNIVELAQLEEQKWRDDSNGAIDQLHKNVHPYLLFSIVLLL